MKQKTPATWDTELKAITDEIEALTHKCQKNSTARNRALNFKQVAMMQGQLFVKKNLAYIRHLTGRDFHLLANERSLMHWGAIFSDSVEQLEAKRMKLYGHQLWLQLIQLKISRVVGKKTGPRRDRDLDKFDSEQVVTMAIRHARLLKTQKTLEDNLLDLNQEKKRLRARFNNLGVAAANKMASGSLSARLYSPHANRFENPQLKALDSYAMQLFSLRGGPTLERQIKRSEHQQKQFGDAADRLLRICRNLTIDALKHEETQSDQDIFGGDLSSWLTAAKSQQIDAQFKKTAQEVESLAISSERALTDMTMAVSRQSEPLRHLLATDAAEPFDKR